MNTFKNFTIGVLVVIVLVLGFLLATKETSVVELGGSGSGQEVYAPQYFRGGFTDGGPNISVATSAAAYTLLPGDLEKGKVIVIEDTGTTTAVALSLTLPNFSSILPTIGDSRTWHISSLRTNAATTTTIVAPANVELQGDGTGSDVINGGVRGKLECYRETAATTTCVVHEYVVAD